MEDRDVGLPGRISACQFSSVLPWRVCKRNRLFQHQFSIMASLMREIRTKRFLQISTGCLVARNRRGFPPYSVRLTLFIYRARFGTHWKVTNWTHEKKYKEAWSTWATVSRGSGWCKWANNESMILWRSLALGFDLSRQASMATSTGSTARRAGPRHIAATAWISSNGPLQ